MIDANEWNILLLSNIENYREEERVKKKKEYGKREWRKKIKKEKEKVEKQRRQERSRKMIK